LSPDLFAELCLWGWIEGIHGAPARWSPRADPSGPSCWLDSGWHRSHATQVRQLRAPTRSPTRFCGVPEKSDW
jgi:hypothetical protein